MHVLRPLTLAALCAALAAPAPPARAATVTFRDVAVVPMDRERVLTAQTVVVRDGTIAALGPAEEIATPAGSVVVDGAGRWLIPALADLHVHLGGEPRLHAALLELFRLHGVTTLLDMWGNEQILELRDRLRRQDRDGPPAGSPERPRLFVAAPPADDPEMSSEEGRELVRRQAAAGYDFAKVYSQLSLDGFEGIAEETRARGIPLVGHLPHAVGLRRALAGGLRMVAHTEEYLYGHLGFRTTDLVRPAEADLDPERISEIATLAAEAGVWTASSLIAFERMLEFSSAPGRVLRRPETSLLSPNAREFFYWNESSRYLRQFPTPAHHQRLRVALDYQHRLVAALSEAGAPLVAGTDATLVGVLPGRSLHEELERLVAAGLSPYRALRAATVDAAAFLGLAASAGTIETGKTTDLLLLNGNPLRDIRNTAQISGLLLRGRWSSAADLGRARTELLDSYLPEQRFLELLDGEGAGAATERFLALREASTAGFVPPFLEATLNRAGYRALDGEGGVNEAIRIFRLNALAYPDSANVHDSLAEAYLRAGLVDLAIASYGKALALDPDGPIGANARRMIGEIGDRPPG